MSACVARAPGKHAIRIGFVPLIDAAPLIAAEANGYFADEGLDVRLDRQIGWGNIRDKLSFGQIHAAHALLGMPPASIAALHGYPEPLVALMALGAGGDAITVSPELAGHAPATWRRVLSRPLNLAHVFSCSSHHYLLRDFLSRHDLIPDRDALLCVMPPPQLVGRLGEHLLDGYCVGEPWNTLAVMQDRGQIVAATTELIPDHPEKVLAVTRRWYRQNRMTAECLVRASLRGCEFCDDASHRGRLTELLARREYLDLDEDVIDRSLSIDRWLKPGVVRPRFRSFHRASTRPRLEPVEWIVRQMMRWGHLPGDTDPHRLAAASIAPDPYTEAVNTIELQGSPA
jgi:ABC-type nitrate/sulfonate/bicarbonate transport system substrate-binding protein